MLEELIDISIYFKNIPKSKQPETGHSKNKWKRVGETNRSTKNQTGQGENQTGTYMLYIMGIFQHMDRYIN
jgi:hypothetical protein